MWPPTKKSKRVDKVQDAKRDIASWDQRLGIVRIAPRAMTLICG
jgi:hypothetical protein